MKIPESLWEINFEEFVLVLDCSTSIYPLGIWVLIAHSEIAHVQKPHLNRNERPPLLAYPAF